MTMQQRATSHDVANLAGVSRSTVSQILNGNDERFPQETRDRVMSAAETLSYRPSRAGRSLVTGLSDLIVVVVPNVTFGPHLQDAVDQLAIAPASRGMSVVVRYASNDASATLSAVLDLRPAIVLDLGVFELAARKAIAANGIQVFPSETMLAQIVEDPNHLIGRLQARHLLASPGRRLVTALLVDDRVDAFGPDRQQGVADEAADRGHPSPTVISVPLNRAGATAALAHAIAENPGVPLGVCCYNDDVAIAVLSAARSLGLSVPDQLAVVGVDNTEIGQLIEPRLTSVKFDLVGMLAEISELLEESGSQFHDPNVYVSLVQGESS